MEKHKRKSFRKPLYLTGVDAAMIRGREGREGEERELESGGEGEGRGDYEIGTVGGGGGEGSKGENLERKVYFEQLDVQPVQLKFSFVLPLTQRNQRNVDEDEEGGGAGLGRAGSTILAILSLTNISSINGVTFYWKPYIISHSYSTRSEHWDSIVANYVAGGLRQAHVLVLGSEVLGNPMRVFSAVIEGVRGIHAEIQEGFRDGNVMGAVGGGVRGVVGLCRTVGGVWLQGMGGSMDRIREVISAGGGDVLATNLPGGGKMHVRNAIDGVLQGTVGLLCEVVACR